MPVELYENSTRANDREAVALSLLPCQLRGLLTQLLDLAYFIRKQYAYQP